MKSEKYERIQDVLITHLTLMAVVNETDLGEFIGAIDSCDAAAPIIDPTLYRAGMRRMGVIRELAVATLANARKCRGIRAQFAAIAAVEGNVKGAAALEMVAAIPGSDAAARATAAALDLTFKALERAEEAECESGASDAG